MNKYQIKLIDSLKNLINGQTPYNKISISLLCKKADVSRGTFYNHYDNIEALLIESIYLE